MKKKTEDKRNIKRGGGGETKEKDAWKIKGRKREL